MRAEGAGTELRVELGSDKEGMVFDLDYLNQISLRIDSGDDKTAFFKFSSVFVIKLVSMAMAFGDNDVIFSFQLRPACRRGRAVSC